MALARVLAVLAAVAASASATFSSSAAAQPLTALPKPVRVVLDTDIGTDFDDTWALHFILSRPDLFDLKLVQVSTFNTTKRAQVAGSILATLGRFDIPLALGRHTGEQGMPQYSFNAAFDLQADFVARGGTLINGTQALAALLATSTAADPVIVIEISPPTSLSDVLADQPSLAANAIVVAMSGSVYRGYENSSSPSSEYNVHEDLPASQRVYAASWSLPLVQAPTDTGEAMQIFDYNYQFLLAAANATAGGSGAPAHPFAASLVTQYKAWYGGGGRNFAALRPFSPTTGTSTLWDLQAAYMAGAFAGWRQGAGVEAGALPSWPAFVIQQLPLYVDASGHTVINATLGKPVASAVGWAGAGGWGPGVDAIAADVIGSIVAA